MLLSICLSFVSIKISEKIGRRFMPVMNTDLELVKGIHKISTPLSPCSLQQAVFLRKNFGAAFTLYWFLFMTVVQSLVSWSHNGFSCTGNRCINSYAAHTIRSQVTRTKLYTEHVWIFIILRERCSDFAEYFRERVVDIKIHVWKESMWWEEKDGGCLVPCDDLSTSTAAYITEVRCVRPQLCDLKIVVSEMSTL